MTLLLSLPGFSFPCLKFSGSIIYSDGDPQARVGGIEKEKKMLAVS